MKDEDEYIMKQFITIVGCIPTYMETFANKREFHHTKRMCKNTTDYHELELQLWDFAKSLEMNNSTYKRPCSQMITSVAIRDDTFQNNTGMIKIKFAYHQSLYRVIANTKAYSFETLLGQVGGFIGR